MDYIISTGLIENNFIEISDKVSVYTDIKVYTEFQSLYFTFICKEAGLVCASHSSISEETSDGEYITRVEIELESDDCKITYGEHTWVSTYYEDDLYITLPNAKILFYNEEYGFINGEELKNLKSFNSDDIS
jgi:hypothetical protein